MSLGSLGSNCSENSNCTPPLGCTGKVCFDNREPESLVLVYGLVLAGVLVLLTSCMLCEFRARVREFLSFYRRAEAKRKKAEAEAAAVAAHKAEAEAAARLADASQAPADRIASAAQEKFMDKFSHLLASAQAHVSRLRQDAAIRSIASGALQEDRASTAARLWGLVLLLVKHSTLASLGSEKAIERALLAAEHADAAVVEAEKPSTSDKRREALRVVELSLTRFSNLLKRAGVTRADEVMGYYLNSPGLSKLQLEIAVELNGDDGTRLANRTALTHWHFTAIPSPILTEATLTGTATSRFALAAIRNTILPFIPSIFRGSHGVFHVLFFLGMAACFAAFAVRIHDDSNAKLQKGGVLGSTFLPVPPYYNLAEDKAQRILVPLLYAIMHAAMYCFCWLPIPFARGFWRDATKLMPLLRRVVPIDTFKAFHKLIGCIMLGLLLAGGAIFVGTIGARCRNKDDARSCQAFEPVPPADRGFRNYLSFAMDPTSNVLALRKLVVLLWFPIMPLLHWTSGAPPKILPAFIAKRWYEITYYAHHIVAHLSFILAMICRFDVFYPSLLTWGLYYADYIREFLFFSYSTEIMVRPQLLGAEEAAGETLSSSIHTDSRGKPTALRLIIERPPDMTIGAGQFVYIRVPELGYEWHPFSLASASTDTNLELLVGVIGDRDHWNQIKQAEAKAEAAKAAEARTKARQAKAKPGTMVVAEVPIDPPKFVMKPSRATWTFKLEQLMRRRIGELAFRFDGQVDEVKPIHCVLRGPYGSTFNDAFNPKYTGVVVVGAGTGLTAALSVLRELVMRRRQNILTPKYVWFVWATRDTNDLLLLWSSMTELLLDALHDGVLRAGGGWSPDSHMLDWLCVTIYVTQGSRDVANDFVKAVAPEVGRVDAGEWASADARPPRPSSAMSEAKPQASSDAKPPRASPPRPNSATGEAKPQASSDASPPRASPPRPNSAMGEDKPQADEAKPQASRVIEVKPHAGDAEAPASVEMEVVELTSVDEAPAPEEAKAPASVDTSASVADVEVIEMVEAAHEISLESLDDVDVGMDDGIAARHERRGSHAPMAAHGARRIVTPSQLHAWLTHSHRLLISKSMDDADCHILKLLQWVRLYLNRKVGRGRRITIACCGPPSVAHTVADAAERVGGDVQFAAEHV